MGAEGVPPRAVVIRRTGDPFEADAHESAPPPTDPAHVDLLHRLFYASEVDLGALVQIGPTKYICTRAGWREFGG